MKKLIILVLLCLFVAPSLAQQSDSSTILRYMEKVRTAIAQKDVKVAESMLPDLIFVNEIIRDSLLRQKSVVKKIGKEEFLRPLKSLFKKDSYVNVCFSDVDDDEYESITQSGVNPKMYGVRLKVDITSKHYSISGFLFVVLELSDEMPPIAHVLTWQPELVGGKRQRPDDGISTLEGFDL